MSELPFMIKEMESKTLEEMKEITECEKYEYYLALEELDIREMTEHNKRMVMKLKGGCDRAVD